MSANATLQNLLWEKNPTGIQDFTYQFTEAELVQLDNDMWAEACTAAEAEGEAKPADECDRHHCECCEN